MRIIDFFMEHESMTNIILESIIFSFVFGMVKVIKKITSRKNGKKSKGNIIIRDDDSALPYKVNGDTLSEKQRKAEEDAKYMLRYSEFTPVVEQEPWEKKKRNRNREDKYNG